MIFLDTFKKLEIIKLINLSFQTDQEILSIPNTKLYCVFRRK